MAANSTNSPDPIDPALQRLVDFIVENGVAGGVSANRPVQPLPNSSTNGTRSSPTQTSPDQTAQNLPEPVAITSDVTDPSVNFPTDPPPDSVPNHPPIPTTSNQSPSEAELRFVVTRLANKMAELERQVVAPTELINPILPLITELLLMKGQNVHGALLTALIPIIDEAIQARSQQDEAKMAGVIGQILPAAIRHEIAHSPTSVAKALAPEVALALQEQTTLDAEAVASVLGPQMGEAIKTQIIVERDAMVDALYPVIGSTIAKYMLELVQTINEKVEASLSIDSIRRKIRAKLQGVSEAELILRESLGFKIQSILLVHKASGLVIRHLQPDTEFRVEADLLAGMLTAMRSFVGECITQPDSDSELHEIEYDASKIILEIGGYCYLAVLVRGNPTPELITRIRDTLGQIILKASKPITAYAGDPSTVPNTVDGLLNQLAQIKHEIQSTKRKFPTAIHYLLALFLLLGGVWGYRTWIARQVEARSTVALDSTPELAIYRLTPQVEWGQLILKGKVPSVYLRDRARAVVQPVAPDWPLRNQILAVEVPADPSQTQAEIQRVLQMLNRKPGVALTADHILGSHRVQVRGFVAHATEINQLSQSLQAIPGLQQVTNTVQVSPILASLVTFAPNSSQPDIGENRSRIDGLRQFLVQHPNVSLQLIGYSDATGDLASNKALSLARARAVQTALVDLGIAPQRLQAVGQTTVPPTLVPQSPLWMSRVVRVEILTPSQK